MATLASRTARVPVDRMPPPRLPIFLLIVSGILVLLGLAVFLLIRYWPFEQGRVVQRLQQLSDSRVQIRSSRSMYFPHPGCILEGVTFVHDPSAAKPLITIEKLTIQTTYLSLLRRHLSLMNAEGLRIFVPPVGTGRPFHTTPSMLTVDQMVANGAVLEISLHEPGKKPLAFDIHEATLRDVPPTGPYGYHIKVRNPEPPGEISADGEMGDWDEKDPPQTTISGQYNFEKANLGHYDGIVGTLSSSGKFQGQMGSIAISGKIEIPDFGVRSAGHRVPLHADFSAHVNGIHGDVFLDRVQTDFGKTQVLVSGSIAESENTEGKVASLRLSSHGGRIEDVLALFVQANRPPMSGIVTLHGNLKIPSGSQPFLRKLRLDGGFGIEGGEFTDSSTQQSVDNLSAGAHGEKETPDPESVLTDLTGSVNLQHGVANFSEMRFGVPGARARMQGTYNILNYKIDLHGQMHLETKAANTSSGVKSLLLKAMDPFFKKKKEGEVIPIQITGTYEHPSFGLDLMDKKTQLPERRKKQFGFSREDR